MARFEIDEVLAKSPLEEVARRLGIETERRGSQLSAICPYHQDTRPSLRFFSASSGSPEHFHCFACGAHGHAIDLVKQVQGVDFIPAVQWLSTNFGIKQTHQDAVNQPDNKVTIENAKAFAVRVFDQHHDDRKFKTWCEERGFDAEFLYKRGIRCIPEAVLVPELSNKSPGDRIELVDGLLSLGLLKRLQQTSDSKQYKLSFPQQFQDYFYDGRILIPILNEDVKRPQLVGFAGRALEADPPDRVPKYLLSLGFPKAKYLFNASTSINSIKGSLKAGDSASLYIVEGFLDALRLQSLGLNAVALMGTSLSDSQYELLKEFIENLPKGKTEFTLNIFLDNDKAGFAGADKLVRRLLGLSGIDLRWISLDSRVSLPKCKDPDTCLRAISSQIEATEWLQKFNKPAEAILLISELGEIDGSALINERWLVLSSSIRERILFKTARAIRQLRGSRPLSFVVDKLRSTEEDWAKELCALLDTAQSKYQYGSSNLFLQGLEERIFHARNLAYHGSRRGELPCDEESWLTLDVSSRLFDRIAQERMKDRNWRQAAPYDAVHLPRKLTSDSSVLDDPRRKVMPHPADLHLQQLLLNELLTQRHDLLSAEDKTFSSWIPAVRWYSGERKVEVTSQFDELKALVGEEPTLSFGYQVDMDVLEGVKTPSDQGMFRPFGQCWRDFMSSLSRQINDIGGRVHVLRLDAQRYYDSIQRYVVRDAMLLPISSALAGTGLETFGPLLGKEVTGSTEEIAEELIERICNFLFGHQFRHPDTGADGFSKSDIGIPQGPVLSAYIGTIALFPVDLAARKFIRRNVRNGLDGKSVPRVGYARYVDDIVLIADSEELLLELRNILQIQSSKSSITLINKGEPIRSGSPELVMNQLNEGRSFVASVPVWEPPFVGDGEAGWGLGGDMPAVDRQCALKMLRHPALMDDPESIQEQISEAMQAPDLRPNDLGLCARWLWWKVATEVYKNTLANDSRLIWERYWELWEYVCDGHYWASEFDRRGYAFLYAVEGLDKLLEPNPWMESDQTHNEVPKRRAARRQLASIVISKEFFRGLEPLENKEHIRWRARLVSEKARQLSGETSINPTSKSHLTSTVTAIEWLCMAAEQIRIWPIDIDDEKGPSPLASIKNRNIFENYDLAWGLCEVLKTADDSAEDDLSNPLFGERDQLALGFVIENASPKTRLNVLAKFPRLLNSLCGDKLLLIQRVPIAAITTLWAVSDELNVSKYIYRFSTQSSSLNLPCSSKDLVKVEFDSNGTPIATLETINFNSPTVSSKLQCEQSSAPVDWKKFEKSAIQSLRQTKFAADLFKSFVAIQNVVAADSAHRFVPFGPQIFSSSNSGQLTLHLIAEPIQRHLLGVSAWYRDADGRVRTASVPHVGADLWRAGWAVADVMGIALDMAGESGLRDEQLSEKTEVSVEHYFLRQQLRKLQGAYLSEAQTWREDEKTGLPRTVERVLQLLNEFDGTAEDSQQVKQLLAMEAETRAMALRIQQSGVSDLRKSMHQVFPAVLNKLPLWVIDRLKLPKIVENKELLRTDFKVMLSLCMTMEMYWTSEINLEGTTKTTALYAALALATVGVGLRGVVSALWGSTQKRGARRMPEQLELPSGWLTPNMLRTDPQSDYNAIRGWLNEGDWPSLCQASPWHWILGLIGLLGVNQPIIFKIPELQHVFSVLADWQGKENEDESAVWPYDGLPLLLAVQWTQVINATKSLIGQLDTALGMRVITCLAPRFNRNPHTDEFIDSSNQAWMLGKAQFTGLGADDRVARRVDDGRIQYIWTETRGGTDNHLLAVHTIDRKLGSWLESAEFPRVEVGLGESGLRNVASRSIDDSQAINQDVEQYESVPTIAESGRLDSNVDQSADVPNEKPEISVETLGHSKSTSTSDQFKIEDFQMAQRRSREKRFEVNKAKMPFRVALFQWKVEDTYAHPLGEVGIKGIPVSEKAKDELREMIEDSSDLLKVDNAAQRGMEHKWTDDIKVISWPEHRRRVLLRQALSACKELGVQLLVLPEVSVRPDTIEWLEIELKDFEGLAVLAGTYRNFTGLANDTKHLRESLNLLWRPNSEMNKSLGIEGANKTFLFERGKKYRAVAAHELFRPDPKVLTPLFTEEKLMERVVDVHAQLGKTLDAHRLPGLANALVHLSPPLRYCMELICSELFLLTSPANYEPLIDEMAELFNRFNMSPLEANNCVMEDVVSVGQLLTVAQNKKYRERRSVLLVPSFTSRSNDYWHAGQASVLASGTATVFCNAVNQASVGGSCFIGINSVSHSHEIAGVVGCLTPYHGWQKGILQTNSNGALSKKDQALVVVDIDPVHVVSGKPRPQLLSEPMSLVAYMPVVELLDKTLNANILVEALELNPEHQENSAIAKALFKEVEGHERSAFYKALEELIEKKENDSSKANITNELNKFVGFFADPSALMERFIAWQNDRHQQPNTLAGGLKLEPAWLDFLVADLTLRDAMVKIKVPPWSDDQE